MKMTKHWPLIALALILLTPLPYLLAQVTHGINWTWAAVTTDTSGNTITVDGYNIYCATAATGPFTTKTNTALIPGTSYLHSGLTVGSTYFCRLTAVKGSSESAQSLTSTGVTFQFPPASPAAPAGTVQ